MSRTPLFVALAVFFIGAAIVALLGIATVRGTAVILLVPVLLLAAASYAIVWVVTTRSQN